MKTYAYSVPNNDALSFVLASETLNSFYCLTLITGNVKLSTSEQDPVNENKRKASNDD